MADLLEVELASGLVLRARIQSVTEPTTRPGAVGNRNVKALVFSLFDSATKSGVHVDSHEAAVLLEMATRARARPAATSEGETQTNSHES